jgi:hypothetical protein
MSKGTLQFFFLLFFGFGCGWGRKKGVMRSSDTSEPARVTNMGEGKRRRFVCGHKRGGLLLQLVTCGCSLADDLWRDRL